MIQENALLSVREVLSRLSKQKALYTPLEVVSVEEQTKADLGLDARVTMSWRRRKVDFVAAVSTRTAPKLVEEDLKRLKSFSRERKPNLLLIVPFLSKTIVEMLERDSVSGLDLNGNYLLQASDMVAIRLDQENQFTESQSIKKIFSGSSSLVGRLLLLSKRPFESVNEVCSEISRRGGSLSLSAVSKVLKGMENELMIEKTRERISVIQPEKLLQRLEEDYRPPKVVEILRIKLPGKVLANLQTVGERLPSPVRWIVSGESSVGRYAVTTPSEISTIYATDFGPLTQYEDERFYNIVLKKTFDSFPYFDSQKKDGVPWSSLIQCFLELSKQDKREREIAESVRQAILEPLK
jgi:hypothetical protein